MQAWKLEIVDSAGKRYWMSQFGTKSDILSSLQSSGSSVITMFPDLPAAIQHFISGKKTFSNDMVKNVCSYLKGLLDMGIGLKSALLTVSQTLTKKADRESIKKVVALISEGYSLADALEKLQLFPTTAIGSIRAGEMSGNLSASLENLVNYFSEHVRLTKEIKRIMVYPLVSLFIVIGVSIYMIMVVVPSLQPLFADSAPPITRFMFGVSYLLRNYWWAAILALLTGVFVLYILRQKGYINVNQIGWKFPVFGKLLMDMSFTFLFTDIHVLLKQGLPLSKSVSIMEVTAKDAIKRKMVQLSDGLAKGITASEVLARDKFFPPIVVEGIKHAEATGDYISVFGGLSEFYKGRCNDDLRLITASIEPIMLVIGGGILFILAISMFLPIYQRSAGMAAGGL